MRREFTSRLHLLVEIYFLLICVASWVQFCHVNYSVKFFVFRLKQKSKFFSISFYYFSLLTSLFNPIRRPRLSLAHKTSKAFLGAPCTIWQATVTNSNDKNAGCWDLQYQTIYGLSLKRLQTGWHPQFQLCTYGDGLLFLVVRRSVNDYFLYFRT